ncbi:Nicotinamide/nicotinic acid mononucleotide adenylyltransferase [Capsicum chinense]|nr:Nicotinamide/nicotinic acid mononucleotide adenylyltransferase [Capsicum chinense]
MRAHADSHRTDTQFVVGNWVFVKLQHYRQSSLASFPNHKLLSGKTDIALPLAKLSLDLLKQVEGPSSPERRKRTYVVLVSTGSFNPPTYMHLRCFELARDALTSEGFCVIGGYMLPVNDAYKKKSLISAEHRVAMCQLACKSSELVMTDPWEGLHLKKFVIEVLDLTAD